MLFLMANRRCPSVCLLHQSQWVNAASDILALLPKDQYTSIYVFHGWFLWRVDHEQYTLLFAMKNYPNIDRVC